MEKIALITGATAGIGKATAWKFAENGWNVIITGRRSDRLTTLAEKLESENGIKALPLNFDVRHFDECEQAISGIPEEWKAINVLVNNAGLAAGLSPIDEGKLEHWEQMIDTNVKGLLYMSKMCIPFLKKTRGHIINIGSTAGKETYLKGNVYCATKYAVDALTKGMRIDLLPHHIKVTSVCPGAAETEFSLVRLDWNEEAAKDAYKGYEPMSGDDVANVVWFCANQPPNVCINDVVMTSIAQANTFYIHREE